MKNLCNCRGSDSDSDEETIPKSSLPQWVQSAILEKVLAKQSALDAELIFPMFERPNFNGI